MNEKEFKGKVAVITGAAGGIGLAITKALSNRGTNVIASDITPLETVSEQLENVTPIICDVTSKVDTEFLAQFAVENYGKIDYLVHTAGILQTGGIEKQSLDDWEKVIKVNLTGTFLILKAFFPIMKKQRKGKIVALGSVAGKSGGITSAPQYIASKGGIHSLLKGLAQEGAQFGVYVNGIAPGPIRTKMTQKIYYDTSSFPLNRLGEPEDIVGAALYLLSDMSNWVTGQVLDVNGGIKM